MERFDLQEIVTGLELGHGEGYCGATANPMSGDLPDAVGDVLQTGGDGVAARVLRLGSCGFCGVEGLDLRLQDCGKMSEKESEKIGESNASEGATYKRPWSRRR